MTLPTTCPGCGAPYAAACGYCGRGKVERIRDDRQHGIVAIFEPQPPHSFWRNLLASASTIGSVRL